MRLMLAHILYRNRLQRLCEQGHGVGQTPGMATALVLGHLFPHQAERWVLRAIVNMRRQGEMAWTIGDPPG
jgi:hypothetical protein